MNNVLLIDIILIIERNTEVVYPLDHRHVIGELFFNNRLPGIFPKMCLQLHSVLS